MRCAPQTVAVLVAQEAELAKPSTSQERTSAVITPALPHPAVQQTTTVQPAPTIPPKSALQHLHILSVKQQIPHTHAAVLSAACVQEALTPAAQQPAG